MRKIAELVSREDVLRGELELTLQDIVGEPLTVKIKALKRSALMALMRKHPQDWDARLAEECLVNAADFDRLDLGSLAEVQLAAGALCLGLPEAKKREEVRMQMVAALASLNSSEPPVNSAPTAGAVPSSPS